MRQLKYTTLDRGFVPGLLYRFFGPALEMDGLDVIEDGLVDFLQRRKGNKRAPAHHHRHRRTLACSIPALPVRILGERQSALGHLSTRASWLAGRNSRRIRAAATRRRPARFGPAVLPPSLLSGSGPWSAESRWTCLAAAPPAPARRPGRAARRPAPASLRPADTRLGLDADPLAVLDALAPQDWPTGGR